MKKNSIFSVLLVVMIVLIVSCVSSKPTDGQKMAVLSDGEAGMILNKWLSQKDSTLSKRCKVSITFDGPSKDVSFMTTTYIDKGNHVKISGILCGNRSHFWVNKKTRVVDCYISYCGRNIGKKYCGNSITNDLCSQ